MESSTKTDILAHVAAEYPREACGLIVVQRGKERYRPCRNVAVLPTQHFIIDPEDYAAAEDAGKITCIVHSHPNSLPLPSQDDLAGCERSGLPWLIVNWPLGTMHQFAPTGYQAPLIGRRYIHGVQDCFSLVRDYYKTNLDIDLPDPPREDEWWLKGQNLYIEHLEAAGGVIVKDGSVQVHDVFLMQMASPVINHAAVYIGDNKIMQHCRGRLATRDVYGGYWQHVTVLTIRHRSFINA